MTNETIADIVREMRKGVLDWKGERVGVFDYFADRIETAAKATVYTDNSKTLRNALAENERLRAAALELYEALQRLVSEIDKVIDHNGEGYTVIDCECSGIELAAEEANNAN